MIKAIVLLIGIVVFACESPQNVSSDDMTLIDRDVSAPRTSLFPKVIKR